MAEKIERFGLVLTPTEKRALEELALKERITAAAVVRRLVWAAAEAAQIPVTMGGVASENHA